MFKLPQIGNVQVKLDEVRGVSDINYIVVQHDDVVQQSKSITPKKVEDQKWDDEFTLPVHSLQSYVEIIVMRKRTLRKPKQVAHAKIPIPNLQDQQAHHEWYPLLTFMTPKKLQKNIKKEIPQLGEVRLEIKYTALKQKAERTIKGVLIESQWTKDTCGGTLINHGTWMKNPQFLLTLKKEMNVSIKVFQPEGADEKVSFYVLNYDAYWDGHPKVVFNNDEIIKIDQFLAALFGEEAEAKLELEKGKYVIIPCCESTSYEGKFSVNVWSDDSDQKDPSKITYSLETLPLEGKQWITKSIEGEWNKNTAGGGNIVGLNWRKNPQYLLTIDGEDDADACITLSQPEKDLSIGFYVIKYTGYGRKEIEYKNEVGKTDSFKFAPSVGVQDLTLKSGSKYVIIPCTSEPKVGKFTLSVYADRSYHIEELTKKWEYVSSKRSAWKGETAGGSPNEQTFTENPQFVLTFPEGLRTEFVVDLTVGDEYEAIGYLVVQRNVSKTKKRLTRGKVTNDDVYCKPEGWLAQISVCCYTSVTENAAKESFFVIIPSTFKAGVEKSFRLTVYADHEVKLDRLGDEGVLEESDDDEEEYSDEEDYEDEEDEEEDDDDDESEEDEGKEGKSSAHESSSDHE